MSLTWENSLAVLEVFILVCSSVLPHVTLSTCSSEIPILGSGHVWLYPLDTVPTVETEVFDERDIGKLSCLWESIHAFENSE